MKQYLALVKTILDTGTQKGDRTGTGTLSIFGHQVRFNLSEGFPLVTTKKVNLDAIIHELLWFLKGETNLAYLHQHNIKIWDEWADGKGNLGPIYGKQWREWTKINGDVVDQIKSIITQIKTTPNSRRIIVSSWNVSDLPDESISPQANVAIGNMALAPCHTLFQFYVANNKLSCQLYQRSCDVFLGLPFNIASYALLTHMVAQQCNLEVGDLVWTGGDVHLYNNHIEQAKEQLQREPYNLPDIKLASSVKNIFDYNRTDFDLVNYTCHAPIKAKIAV
jgi:thymidylate synthase